MYICTYMLTHMYMYMYVHVYIYVYILTLYIYTYKHMFIRSHEKYMSLCECTFPPSLTH